MAVVRIRADRRIVIPKDVREKFGFMPGDWVELIYRRNTAVIRRTTAIDETPATDKPTGRSTRSRKG